MGLNVNIVELKTKIMHETVTDGLPAIASVCIQNETCFITDSLDD